MATEAASAPTPIEGTSRVPRPIASWSHLAGYLLITAGIATWGIHLQRAGSSGAATGQLTAHSQAIGIYISAILADVALVYYCWVGVHRRGGKLATLSGGRWKSWKAVGIDIAIAFPFWVVWEATAYGVHWILGPDTSSRSVGSVLPRSVSEILLWILVSITAGFCEELQSRGYLQQQLHALSGSIAIAVLAQGLVFGVMHAYQGWKNVAVISVVGVLYGILAAWRGNLRANMIAHAWSDIWGGWLQRIVLG